MRGALRCGLWLALVLLMVTKGGFVQGVYTDDPGSPSTVALAPVQAGNLLVATFARLTNSTPTVTDSQGNLWALARSHYDAGNDYRLDLWTAVAGQSGACSITITAAGGAGQAIRAEYQGAFAPTRLDVVNSAIGTSTSPSSGAATPRGNDTLVLGYLSCTAGVTIAPSGSFVEDVDGTPDTNANTALESQVQGVAASIAATGTLGSSTAWIAILATFVLAPVAVNYREFPKTKMRALAPAA